MLQVQKHGVLLKSTSLGFENEDVLNPAAIRIGDKVHLFYRAVSKGNYSSIGYCRLNGPLTIEERHDVPLLFPQFDYESHGIEDARITQIDGIYYLTYTAFDGINALGALATSIDLVHFEKKGIITPQVTFDDFRHLAACKCALNEKYARYNDRNRLMAQADKKVLLWDKNLIFFPRRINGKFYFLHRIKPDIQISSCHELSDLTKEYWEQFFLHFCDNIVMTSKHEHEVCYIGGGSTPIETPEGWLLIYHGVYDTPHGYVYSACAALLDLENPHIELARLPYPLFKPGENWELMGEVNNVCFPTGSVLFGDMLYIYYGAADERIACASVSLKGLLEELKGHV